MNDISSLCVAVPRWHFVVHAGSLVSALTPVRPAGASSPTQRHPIRMGMFWAMAANDTKNRKWSEADVPDQSGRVVIVTGANTGIGYRTAAVLADRGAHVVLAVRNLEKGNPGLARIFGGITRA